MKNKFLLAVMIAVAFFMSSCATWSGIKYDSSKAWRSTKKAVHDATAD